MTGFMRDVMLGLLALILSSSATSADRAPAPRISGIYSNLRYNAEGGDLLGMEILILPNGSDTQPSWTAVVQIAEGGAPLVSVVPLYQHGSSIEFQLPPQGVHSGESYAAAGDHFTGTVENDSLTVRWSGGTIEKLVRGKSYWQ